ncbi:hypothetical protein K1719_012441 [Acacia pycnantha]|nr:hypothetical protein K1719_012441 [Acacia pycnantha]
MEKLLAIELFILLLCLLISFSVGSRDGHLITCLVSDREALMDFKSGLQDPNNVLSSWRGNNCCQWYGIVCDNNTRAVVTVDLHNPYLNSEFESSSGRYAFWKLSGEIRPSLMKLKSLRILDLSFSTFSGIPIPEFFGSLENVQYLNLSNAGFSGLIPAHLGNLSHLEVLDLHNVGWNGLYAENFQWITGLISLEHLAMNGVNLSLVKEWAAPLNQLPFIVELHLSRCDLSGYIPSMAFLNFSSLAVIDLSFNNFHSMIPDWLVNISSLQHIHMSEGGLYGRIPLALGEMPNLLSLDLSLNYQLTLSCSQLFSKRWEKIEFLELSWNKIHGKLPLTLGNMTSLILLGLSSNAVVDGIPSFTGIESFPFRNPLPNMQHLDLSLNQLVGQIPYWLGQLENIVDLDLGNNLFEGPIPTFESLQNLANLDLAENKLNGTLPASIGQLSGLSTFDVSSNQLEGIISEIHFSKLINLTFLDLSSNLFIVNISSNWMPPFQVRVLIMSSCILGPTFPSWLQSQKG